MVFSRSGGVTCEPVPPVRAFGILSEMFRSKSYTENVGGSIMPSKAFHSMGCMQNMLYVARSVGGSYNFSWAYPFTGRDSKASEHIQIYVIDVVGGRRTGSRSHTQSQSAERWKNWKRMCGVLGDWENEREDPRGSCTGHC